jgi:hypothetical protein
MLRLHIIDRLCLGLGHLLLGGGAELQVTASDPAGDTPAALIWLTCSSALRPTAYVRARGLITIDPPAPRFATPQMLYVKSSLPGGQSKSKSTFRRTVPARCTSTSKAGSHVPAARNTYTSKNESNE